MVFGEEEELLGSDIYGNIESLLVILLGIVEEVSNINDLVLVIKFSDTSSCKSSLELGLCVGFCFFSAGDDGCESFGVIVRVSISLSGEVEVKVDVEC